MDSFSNLVNDNTINLYHGAAYAVPTGNLMISPFSILHSTMLLYFGAHGKTKSNLDDALLFKKVYKADKTAALTDFFNSMTSIKSVWNESNPSRYMIVSVSNAVFVDKRVELKPMYVVNVGEKLHALIQNKDFALHPDQSRKEINLWIKVKTGGLIKDLLSSDHVDSTTLAVLVNTVYYNATWDTSFKSEETAKEDFTNIDGTKVSVDMMKKHDTICHTHDKGLGAGYAEVDYYNKETSMLILLPDKEDGLRAVEKKLTVKTLRGLKQKTTCSEMDIELPKFTTESQVDLVELLRKVGVQDVFAANADFSDMTSSGSGLFFNRGVHKTYISVDEQGTVAAAASALSGFKSMPMRFVVDHPFFYAIRHNPTDTLLFVGRVEKF